MTEEEKGSTASMVDVLKSMGEAAKSGLIFREGWVPRLTHPKFWEKGKAPVGSHPDESGCYVPYSDEGEKQWFRLNRLKTPGNLEAHRKLEEFCEANGMEPLYRRHTVKWWAWTVVEKGAAVERRSGENRAVGAFAPRRAGV